MKTNKELEKEISDAEYKCNGIILGIDFRLELAKV